MHPYRNFHNEDEHLRMRNTGVIRIWASFVVLFGIIITALEINGYFADDSAKYTFLSMVGTWSGITVFIAGIFSLSCARKNFQTGHQARRTVICHVSFSLLAGINSMGMLGFHLVSIFGYLNSSNPLVDVAPVASSVLLQTLECTSMSLYVVSFMLLSALIGCSIAFYRSIPNLADYSRVLHAEQDTITPIFVPALKRPITRSQVVTDIEATVDGYYRRLEEEEDDN